MSRFSRSWPFSRFASVALMLLVSLQGCDCGPTDVDIRRFACTRDDECAPGFLCHMGECRPEGEPVDVPDAGRPDGGADAGAPDGGGPDGGPDAGVPDGGTGSRPTSIIFITPSRTVLAGVCSPMVELEVRDALGMAAPFPAQTAATLEVKPDTGLAFFSDPGCTTATSEALFSPGATTARFYFKSQTGSTYTLFASPPGIPPASQEASVLPVVRTGTCLLADGSTSVTCTISPAQTDMTKTLLLFQTSSSSNSPDAVSVRCSLTALDAITCSRNLGSGGVGIQWQTAELASGLKVQHLQASCGGTSEVEVPITPVSRREETFLLVSARIGGLTVGPDDFYTATLAEEEVADHVHLRFGTNCVGTWAASLQVVELEGVNVTRGETGPMSGSSLVASNLPAVDPASTALLFTYRVSNASGVSICDRVLRGELTSPTSLTFSRGAGFTGCAGASIDAIAWERIEFGTRARAQHFLMTMANTVSSLTQPISAVDPTRTLVFATGQAVSGQAMGESSYVSDDTFGVAMGLHSLTTPTTLRVTRGSTLGAARWTSTVLQLEP